MPPRIRRLLARTGSFVLAGGLLYLALRGVDFGEVGQALRTADYWWLLPLTGITLLSHLSRAWRWQILLEALPADEHGAAPKKVSLRIAFDSIMIGYMANQVTPRLGELVRSANMARQESIPFARVLGTVVVDRLLDMVVLFLALVSVGILLFDRFSILQRLFITPVLTRFEQLPLAVLLGLGLVLLAGGSWLVILLRRRSSPDAPGRLRGMLASFRAGLVTLVHTPRKIPLLLSTVLMWFCYTLMAYFTFLIFHMNITYGLSMVDAWNVMNLGAIGIAIPSPGGVGSYHYVTIQSLVHLFGVGEASAASYAILGHAGQMILYTVVGALCLLLQGSSFRSLKKQAVEAGE